MYDDDQALRAELRRLAEADPLGPISADDLLVRGRRGRRRRQVLSATGVAALVAAVAVAAATLPELDGERGNAVAGNRTAAITSPTPSAGRPATTKPTPIRPTSPRPTGTAGSSLRAAPDAGSTEILRACSAKLSALKSRSGKSGPPVPAATDLTGWNVVVRAIQPKVGTAFVALSPDRKLNATCVIYTPGAPAGMDTGSDTGAWPAPLRARKELSPHLFTVGTNCDVGLDCSGFLYTSLDQVPAKVARIRATATNGRFVDLRPRDGWLAVMWPDGGSAGFGLNYRAYDARGREIELNADRYNDEVRRETNEMAKKRQR